MTELLTGLEVSGYRQFDHFEMEGLRRVNLLVGRNNAGKTALLEAVQILSTRPALGIILGILFRRGESEMLTSQRGNSAHSTASLRHLFPAHEMPLQGQTLSIRGKGVRLSVELSIEPLINVEGSEMRRSLQHFVSEGETEVLLNISEDGNQTYSNRLSRKGLFLGENQFRLDAEMPRFLTTSGIDTSELAKMYDTLFEEAREEDVIRALQLLDPRITGLHFRSGGGAGRYSPGNILFSYRDTGRYPLGSAGEGMRRMLGLALALSNAKGGVLIIDEIDTGLHYSVMSDLWRLVTETARRLDLQVFATTHSLDCVRGLSTMCRESPELMDQVAVHTIDVRRGRSVPSAGEELLDAVQFDLELR